MGKNWHFQALFCTKYPLKPPKKRYFFGHEIYFMTKIREKSCAETGEHRTTPALQLHNIPHVACEHHHRRRIAVCCTTAPAVLFLVLRGFGGKGR